jgi:hypothetical protein
MGQWTSRQNAANAEEAEIGSQQYKYPPKSGKIFFNIFNLSLLFATKSKELV